MKRLIVCLLCMTAALCAQDVEKFIKINSLKNDLSSLAAMRKLREDFGVTQVETLEIRALENQVSLVRRTVWPTLLMIREVRESGNAADFDHAQMALRQAASTQDLLYTPEGVFQFYAAPVHTPERRTYSRVCSNTQLFYPKDWSKNLYVDTAMPLRVMEKTFHLMAEENQRTNHPDLAELYRKQLKDLRATVAGAQSDITMVFDASTLFLKRTDKGLVRELSITERGSKISVYIANTFETAPVAAPPFTLRDCFSDKAASHEGESFGFSIGMVDGMYQLIPNTHWGVYLYGGKAFVEFTKSPIVSINGRPAPELSQTEVDALLKTQDTVRIEFAIPPTSRTVTLGKLNLYEQSILHCAAQAQFSPEKFFE